MAHAGRVLHRHDVDVWVSGYERAWRTSGTELLAGLFTDDVHYRPSPWREPSVGLAALSRAWAEGRDGPGEEFTMTYEVVAVDGWLAVVRVAVTYRLPLRRWRDLWVLRFTGDGRVAAFEEWPFAPDQPDGH